MTAAHRGTLLLLVAAPVTAPLTGLLPAPAAAQEEPPHIEFDTTVFTGRNPFLIAGDKAMNTGGEVSAQGGAVLGVDRKTTLDLGGRLAYRGYGRRYGTFVTGHADAAIDHRASERFSLHSEASYARVLPLEAQISSIDAAIDPVSLQDRYQLRQDARWRPNAYTTITGRVTWDRLAPRGSQLLSRTDATSLALGTEHRLSPSSWIGFGTLGTFSTSADGSRSDSAIFVLKAGTRLAPDLSVEAEGGLSKIARRERDGRRNGGPAQPAAAVMLCYDPRRLRICLSARISPVVTSFGGIQREKSLSATFGHRIGTRGNLTAAADYRQAPAPPTLSPIPPPAGPASTTDARVLRLSTAYEHTLDSRFRLHVGADYDRRTGMASQTLGTWTIRAGVTFRIPSR